MAEDRRGLPFIKSVALRQIAAIVFLCVYLAAGVYTDTMAVTRSGVFQDFRVYEVALHRALAHDDPYATRTLGGAFIYPLPALFVVELFSPIASQPLLIAIYTLVNILLLLLMIVGVARLHHLPLRRVWWWFVLGLGFAPFFELVRIGQINMVTAFAVFLMFLWQQTRPTLAGTALAVAVVTKVTPFAFAAYLLIQRNYKAIIGLVFALILMFYAAGLRYGIDHTLTYGDVFSHMLEITLSGSNPQSLLARLRDNGFFIPNAANIQLFLNLYVALLMILSGLMAFWLKRFDALFVVLQIGITLAPNVLWYHHYIFLLLPLLVWMALSKLHQTVVIWCALGLLLIQVDRDLLTRGLLIHVFGHLTLLIVIAGQARDSYRRWQHRLPNTLETAAANG